MRALYLITVATSVWLGGCAAVTSTADPTTDHAGLQYYMPKRDILISVTNAGGKVTSVTATASTPYADRRKSFLLEYQPHLLAKNAMDLDVSEAGLLTNSTAKQAGDAVSALGAIGTLAGYVRGSGGVGLQSAGSQAAVAAADAPSQCTQDGTHTLLVPAEKPGARQFCGNVTVTIERLGWQPVADDELLRTPPGVSSGAGIYYRMNLPYKVTMTVAGKYTAQTIVHSPSESRIHFLPVARTLFSNNDAKITLSHGAGVPSKYVQDTDGELAALLKLPAAVLTPYFAAIGQMFDFRSTRRTKEGGEMTSSVALELAKLKYQKCLDAIEAKDTELIASLRCGG